MGSGVERALGGGRWIVAGTEVIDGSSGGGMAGGQCRGWEGQGNEPRRYMRWNRSTGDH